MSLTKKFKEALSGLKVSVSALRQDTRYGVRQAKRVETRYGSRVVLTLLEDDNVISVFLPKGMATLWRIATYIILTLGFYSIILRTGKRVRFPKH
jgi:hypothetical protein